MMNNLINRRTVAFAGALLVAAGVQAATFEGSTAGTFNNAAGGPGMVVSGEGTSFLQWGVAIPPSGRSSLEFTGQSFAAEAGDWFNVGTLAYANGTTQVGTGATSVDLGVELTFVLPSPTGETVTYTLQLLNTLNNNDPDASADNVFLPSPVSEIFTVGGQSYRLELGFGEVTEGGFSTIDELFAREDETARAPLLGRITAVPDGGLTIALLGAALGTVGIFKRRMKF